MSEKQRYFIHFAFKGTRYHGWQIQPNAVTVQGIMNKALSTVTREKIRTTGAGRTDTGVHAKFFMAHFDSDNKKLDNDPGLIYSLNSVLPSDISVYKIFKVRQNANARFDAISRTYEYRISRTNNPFEKEYSWHIYYSLNVEKMNEAAAWLKRIKDFTGFGKYHTNVKTNICRVSYSKWREDGDMLIFTIKADRFLRNMVRAIVGTMVLIGRNKLDITEFKNIVEQKVKVSYTAPPEGLFLTKIEYHVNII
jgi:tRNA pseudouridine38-40 synthase